MRDWQKDWELCQEATPGPWKADIRMGCYAIYPSGEVHNCLSGARDFAIVYQAGRGEESSPGAYRRLMPEQETEAHFIAAARDGWPAALEEIARLREAIETHRRNVWGDKAVGHSEDRDLYEVLDCPVSPEEEEELDAGPREVE